MRSFLKDVGFCLLICLALSWAVWLAGKGYEYVSVPASPGPCRVTVSDTNLIQSWHTTPEGVRPWRGGVTFVDSATGRRVWLDCRALVVEAIDPARADSTLTMPRVDED